MKFLDDATLPLPLMGGVVQAQRLHLPTELIARLPSYRHACRLAWRLRNPRNLTQRSLAEQTGLHTSHVSDYFCAHATRRELPARMVAKVEAIVGNTAITQWLAQQSQLTVLEELQAQQVVRRGAA